MELEMYVYGRKFRINGGRIRQNEINEHRRWFGRVEERNDVKKISEIKVENQMGG